MNYPESKLQCAVVQLLQLYRIYHFSIPNERKASVQAMQRLISMGLQKGVADLCVWWPIPNGVIIGYIEVKAPGGKQAAAQKEFQAQCENNGIRYDLVYSVEDVEKLIKRYLY